MEKSAISTAPINTIFDAAIEATASSHGQTTQQVRETSFWKFVASQTSGQQHNITIRIAAKTTVNIRRNLLTVLLHSN